MLEHLQEYANSHQLQLQVQPQAGLISGIKILGLQSRNGRRYLPEALQAALTQYEGVKVNVNHAKGLPSGPRDYQDRIGTICNVVYRPGAGLFGDFKYNPKHALAEQLAWDAQHAPQNVGFSHNVEAQVSRSGDQLQVVKITQVHSVDLVADPATTQGLFEAQSPVAAVFSNRVTQAAPDTLQTQAALLRNPLLQQNAVSRTGVLQTSVLESPVLQNNSLTGGASLRQLPETEAIGMIEQTLAELQAAVGQLQRSELIQRSLQQHRLWFGAVSPAGEPWVSEAFLVTLQQAESPDRVQQLVEERAALMRSTAVPKAEATKAQLQHGARWSSPQACDQSLAESLAVSLGVSEPFDLAAWAASIR